jgi:hypothetical protein
MKNGRWLILITALAAGSAAAQQYRWTDEKGKVHYSDAPPPASAKNVQKKNLTGNTFAGTASSVPIEALRSFPVTLYTHPRCADACDMARGVLRKRHVPFTEVSLLDLEAPPEIRARSGGRAVPVMRAGTMVEMTASEAAYNRTLDLAGYPPSDETVIRNQAQPVGEDLPLKRGEKIGR